MSDIIYHEVLVDGREFEESGVATLMRTDPNGDLRPDLADVDPRDVLFAVQAALINGRPRHNLAMKWQVGKTSVAHYQNLVYGDGDTPLGVVNDTWPSGVAEFSKDQQAVVAEFVRRSIDAGVFLED